MYFDLQLLYSNICRDLTGSELLSSCGPPRSWGYPHQICLANESCDKKSH